MDEKPKILIVEDEALIAMHLARTLTRRGYTICGRAETGQKATQLARETSPDAILMDVGLIGELNGLKTAEHIRLFSQAPIIFLTGYSVQDILRATANIQNTFCLSKPIQENQCDKLLRQILSER